MEQFKEKIAVITGAGSGIGRALAKRCALEGMHIAVADVHAGRLATLSAELENDAGKVITQELDVADGEAVASFARRCQDELGVPDLLFNNAGILRVGDTWSHSADDWQTMLSINVMGVVNGLNAFVPAMLEAEKPAHIVNTGSVGCLVAAPGMAQYTATKMAVRGITECLAIELAAKEAQIDVSLLCPGPVLTSISDELLGIEATSNVVGADEHLMAGQPDFITAEECAERVFGAIREGRFWIFTHPFNNYITRMTEEIVAGRNPEFVEVDFD